MFAEASGLESIAGMADVYRTTNLRERLERHHGANVDLAFLGWSGVWLDPEFRAWNIEELLPAIEAPMLILQGEQDEYGTWRQVEAIQERSRVPVAVRAIPGCGHSPHREHPDLTLGAMAEWIGRLLSGE